MKKGIIVPTKIPARISLYILNIEYIFSMETCIPSLKYIVVVQSQEWGWLGIHTTLEGKKNVDKMLAKFY